jgi:GDP-4-dehydro-6-deoxy-D-mannose reductase
MRVLITGVTGMAGSHLAEYILTQNDAEVFGVVRRRSRMDNLEDLGHAGRLVVVGENAPVTSGGQLAAIIEKQGKPGALHLVEAELGDPLAMQTIIGGVRPDRIFHLAAQSYVPGSWTYPAETIHVNVIGQVHLLEAVRSAGLDPLIHIAGTSEEYGATRPEELPLKETTPLRPHSPYAVSKVAQELLAFQYRYSYGLRTVVTRAFNHEGPRRGDNFVTSNLAKQIAEIERGLRPPQLMVGKLDSKRDWSDVRDVVRAYWLALEKGEPGDVYNIGSGVARTVEEMIRTLLSFTEVPIKIVQDPARLRPSDIDLQADVSKFRALTGWAPAIPFEETMSDLLDYWRERV